MYLRSSVLPGQKSIGAATWLPWSVLIASIYAFSLTARFDFVDDGNLVYPAPPMRLADHAALWASNVRGNYEHRDAFRPVVWAHWQVQAALLGANAPAWRVTRLLWATASTATLLWLLLELGISVPAAIATTALAMWNPYRAEIWRSLTLAEGVAMPYALFALLCAVRGARSGRARWDVLGAIAALMALGCKNTFAALIPAQLFLRLMIPAEPDARRSRAQRWRGVLLLALPLLLPTIHLIVFVRHHPGGQYELEAPSGGQLRHIMYGVKQAAGIDFVGIGLLLALVTVVRGNGTERHSGFRRNDGGIAAWVGLILLIGGAAEYLPFSTFAPHDSMPAIWGVDIWIGLLASALFAAPRTRWWRASAIACACGAVALALVNVARQDRARARAALLWSALELVEKRVPPNTTVGWVEGRGLDIGEGIHFFWHLERRGRVRVQPLLLKLDGRAQMRPELVSSNESPTVIVTGSASNPKFGSWADPTVLESSYWLGWHHDHCYVWMEGARTKNFVPIQVLRRKHGSAPRVPGPWLPDDPGSNSGPTRDAEPGTGTDPKR